MKTRIDNFIYILIAATLISFNCEDSTSSDNPVPGKVKLVAKSAEDDSIETGVDAEFVLSTQQDGIILQWHPVDDADLVAYGIYRSIVDSSGGFGREPYAEVKGPTADIDTFYIDKNVNVGTRYYYYVRARDEENSGDRSSIVNYKLEHLSNLFSPSPSNTTFNGIFEWEFPSVGGVTPHNFIFRLLYEITPNNYVYTFVEELSVGNKYGPNQSWSLSELEIGQLQPGRYQWRIDIIGTEVNNGSESEWLGFTVQ